MSHNFTFVLWIHVILNGALISFNHLEKRNEKKKALTIYFYKDDLHRNNKEKSPTISQRLREYRFAREYRSGVSCEMFFTSLLITSFIKGCFSIRTFIKGCQKVIFWIVKFYTNHLCVQAFKVKHWKC